ncbi:MAG: plasmid stabilization protein [Betaproteobacteria bacterium RIFCSPLOWO2_02_FULL_63_19]|nr:MAG: plasmid stabilization protein [Betaproteobacteria bacterium RIFCSPLOWO2_02_FULL_63_19]
MPYAIVMRRQAQKKLQSLARDERIRLAEKINQLGHNPDDPALDTKRLSGVPLYRLRVGDWRIIYDRQDAVQIIAIEKIKPRGDAYK